MPCKEPSHTEHVWPAAPTSGSKSVVFYIGACERTCLYCNKVYPSRDARSLRRHVLEVHLMKNQYPGVYLHVKPFEHQKTSTRKQPKLNERNTRPSKKRLVKIVVPIDLLLPPAERLVKLHTLLQLKPNYHTLFHSLADQHLLNNFDISQLYSQIEDGAHDPLSLPATSFLESFGERLWPSDLSSRKHLFDVELKTQPGNFWAFKRGMYGPEFRTDGKASPHQQSNWEGKIGREPSSTQVSAGMTKLGATMQAYFEALLDVGSGSSPRTGKDVEKILAEIIGERGGRCWERGNEELDRDSSPEVPLRIAAYRSKSRSAAPKPSTIAVLPIPRRPSSVSRREFCLPEGCCHGRRTNGVMLACDSSKCPTEWFHPECVGMQGADLGRTKWSCCFNCREMRSLGTSVGGEVRSMSELPKAQDSPQRSLRASSVVTGVQCIALPPSSVSAFDTTAAGDPSIPPEHQLPPTTSIGAPDTPNLSLPSAQQTAADELFIETMQSSLMTRPTSNGQVNSGLAGLSSNLLPQSYKSKLLSVYTDDAMETESTDALFQAVTSPGSVSSESEQQEQRLGEHMASMTWEASSTGVRRALENIGRVERQPVYGNADNLNAGRDDQSIPWSPNGGVYTGTGELFPSDTGEIMQQEQSQMDFVPQRWQQSRQPSLQGSGTDPTHRLVVSSDAISTRSGDLSVGVLPAPQQGHFRRAVSQALPASAAHWPISSPRQCFIPTTIPPPRSRQQSKNMPPPPPRNPSLASPTAWLPSTQVSLPSTPTSSPAVSMAPPTNLFVFAPVQLLPLREWVLPTPETTLAAEVSPHSECMDWERARIEHYLELTGGMGGLPLSEGMS